MAHHRGLTRRDTAWCVLCTDSWVSRKGALNGLFVRAIMDRVWVDFYGVRLVHSHDSHLVQRESG
jgi:hypothetical protein